MTSQKKINDLMVTDFVTHPVWTWADEDEDTVMPFDFEGNVIPEGDDDALFIACQLILNDGTTIPGVLSVRMTDHWVYLVSFQEPSGSFLDLPLQPKLQRTFTRDQLAAKLNKSSGSIFPITYNTRYMFSNNMPLRGKIE